MKSITRYGIFLLFVFVISAICKFALPDSEPESFKKAVELLGSDKSKWAKIGSYESYSYKEQDFPKVTDNPAVIKVAMEGTVATMYFTCIIKKDTLGQWRFLTIKQDSLIAKK